MTMLGLADGDNASNGYGYLDIADFIIKGCTNVEENLKELYRRVAFNICVGNSDDHFRNHGFLLTSKGWTLSPAYDMNPTQNKQQGILISASSCDADLNVLLDACEDYYISRNEAAEIINGVTDTVRDWETTAVTLGISQMERKMFKDRFALCL